MGDWREIWGKLLAWWESLSETEQSFLVFLVAVITAIVAIVAFLKSKNKPTKQKISQNTNGGTASAHMGTDDIHANVTNNTNIHQQINITGLTLEEHEKSLKKRETEVRVELEKSHTADRQVLEIELSTIEQ